MPTFALAEESLEIVKTAADTAMASTVPAPL